MKIYIITYDSAFDFETSHYIVGAYTSLKKANEIFEKEVAKLNTNGYKWNRTLVHLKCGKMVVITKTMFQ